jgi:hypothetical protein
LLLLAFHTGDETLRVDELWSRKVSMDFFLLPIPAIQVDVEAAGFIVEESVERAPYPGVEHQTHRAYVLARAC